MLVIRKRKQTVEEEDSQASKLQKLNPIERPLVEDFPLSQQKLQQLKTTGVLIVENVFSSELAEEGFLEIQNYLQTHSQVNINQPETYDNWKWNYPGGLVPFTNFKIQIQLLQHPNLYSIVHQLHSFLFPTMKYNPKDLRMHHGRACFRLPYNETQQKAIKKANPMLQNDNTIKRPSYATWRRGLKLHIDAVMKQLGNFEKEDGFGYTREIQMGFNLTDSEGTNSGGFEAVELTDFNFENCVQQMTYHQMGKNAKIGVKKNPGIDTKVKSYTVKKGSVTFWLKTVPHRNSAKNTSNKVRATVFGSLLLDCPANHKQLLEEHETFFSNSNPTVQLLTPLGKFLTSKPNY